MSEPNPIVRQPVPPLTFGNLEVRVRVDSQWIVINLKSDSIYRVIAGPFRTSQEACGIAKKLHTRPEYQ